MKEHICPTCGQKGECILHPQDDVTKHNCKFCGSTWSGSVVVSGSGEPE